jgi:hypothetical protein
LSSINPRNDLPTVRLLDQVGAELRLVSQRQAAQLLRFGHGELVLDVPPAVRLLIDTEDYEALSGDNQSRTSSPRKLQFLHARRAPLYGNVHFQGPEGETMFHGDSEKALWYLNRDLVEVISQAPPVLRFKFTPGGSGHAGDPYYLTGKVNHCVVCGATEGLNRHHVVPSVYRRHLPAEVKDHSHHDVLLLCLACHEKYEREADRLKAILGAEHGVPLHGVKGAIDRERGKSVKLASALVRHGATIPLARKLEIHQIIGEWLGKWPLTDADIAGVATLSPEEAGAIEHGQHVIAQTTDVQVFMRRWRTHFLDTMRPQFLPEHWDVDRPACREGREESSSVD